MEKEEILDIVSKAVGDNCDRSDLALIMMGSEGHYRSKGYHWTRGQGVVYKNLFQAAHKDLTIDSSDFVKS